MLGQEMFRIGDYKAILHRRRGVIIVFFIVTVAVVAILSFSMEPVYRATTVLLIDIESPQVLSTSAGVEIGSSGYSSYYSYREYFESQMGIIKSKTIARLIFDEFNLSSQKKYISAKEPLEKFLKTITVDPVLDTRLMKLHVDNKDPELAAKIANRIVDIYIQRNLEYISKNERLNLLKNEYLRLETKLSEYSNIYKDKHPEMIRLKEEMAEVVKSINREKVSDFDDIDAVNRKINAAHPSDLGGLKANNVSVVDYATVPRIPIQPKKTINILVAVMVGLFGGIGLAFFFEYQDPTVKDVEDMAHLSEWPCLGKVPVISGRDKEFHIEKKPGGFIAEAYRSIRTRIFFSDTPQHPLKTIVVSSLGAQEGKTTNICNLGITMARQRRVLLVDADMRKVNLHKIFGSESEKGLGSFLRSEAKYEDVIQKTKIENLFLVADREPSIQPSELLASDKMKEFIKLARKDFDYVLFDTPPIGVITDATVLSSITDGIILIVESGKTPKKAIERNNIIFKDSNIKCAGVIITKAPASGSESYYFSYSYSKST